MSDDAKNSESVTMPTLFAYSEHYVKPVVRHLRRDKKSDERYNVSMKLRITELRKERGLTVQALADAAGMSKSYLSEIANGVKEVNGRRMDALARALGVSTIDLIDHSSIFLIY